MKQKSEPISKSHPQLAKEAFGWDPNLYSAGSKMKVNWICINSHVTSASINNRVKSHGCPICSGHQLLEGWNDLQTSHPELAKEAHGWNPKTVMASSSKSLPWMCPQGHIWSTRVSRRAKGLDCSTCKKNNFAGIPLAISHPGLAVEANGWDPSKYLSDRSKKVSWRCGENHIWNATLKDRKSGRGCPECGKGKGGKKVRQGVNDFKTLFPELSLQAHGWNPQDFLPGSSKRMEWICQESHIWKAAISQRARTRSGCPYCAGQRAIAGKNDLRTLFPEIAKQAFEWNPREHAAFSDRKMSWKCSKGHVYISPISSRTRGGNGCHYCSGQKVLAGFNDLKTTHPEVAAKAFHWNPTIVNCGSDKKRDWICDYGHVWRAAVKDLVSKENGCPYCSGRIPIVGVNDLLTTDPALASQADGWDPTMYKAQSSSKKLDWKCPEGHRWKATISARTSSTSVGRGCPSCAKTGFDPLLPGWIYLMSHEQEQMLQIGISNFPLERTSKHAKKGWELLDLRGPLAGDVARAWETSMLKMLNRRGVKFGFPKDHKVVGRNTESNSRNESWMSEGLTVGTLRELMELVEQDEND